MAVCAYYCFDYERDLLRAKTVFETGIVDGVACAGFTDLTRWAKLADLGSAAIQQAVDDALATTTATIVLIGEESAKQASVTYAIEKSLERGNKILPIYIHMIKDENKNAGRRGTMPKALAGKGYKAQFWPFDDAIFSQWVQDAFA